MANTIKLAHNATSGKTPTDLASGEVAINSANKKIWVGTNGTTAGQVLLFDHSIYSTDLSDNDTTYTAGGGLSLSGTVFSHSNTSSQGSINGTGRQYIQDVTLDTYGHVTGLGVATETVTNTNTTYSAGTGLSLSGTTFSLNGAGIAGGNISWDGTQLNASIGVSNVGAGNGLTGGGGSATSTLHVGAGGGITVSADAVSHADTSSQGSINLSGRSYIQDLTLDAYGHVTGYGYGTETITDSDTNTTYSAGTALTLSGTTFSLTNSTQYLKKLSAGSAANLDTYTDNGFRSVSHTGHSKLLLSMNAGGSTGTFQLENHYNGQCRVRNKVDSSTWADWEYLVSTTTGQTAISGTILHTGNLTAGGGLTRSGTTISHNDTSSQGSINLSGRSYIQDLTLDTYGHVTGYGYGTETVTNTNTTYTAGTGLSLSGTTFNMTAAGVGVRGGVKLGYPESGQFYPVEAHGTSERLYVNVPWQNTTYVVQDGGLTQKNFTTTLKNKLDGITGYNYSAGSGLSLSGTTFSHSDTSSQGSINLSGRSYIQDLTLDTYGHVTGYGYATETVTNTNTTYSAGTGLTLSGTTFSIANSGAYVSTHGAAQDRPVGWYTIATNGGHRAIARFGLRDTRSGDHQSVIFYASHNYGQNLSNVITVLHASHFSGNPYRYIRIKENGTYDGAVLQVYIDDATNDLDAYLLGDNFQANGWVLKDWIADATDPGGVSNYSSMTAKGQVDLNQVAQGGIVTTGDFYGGGDTTQYKLATENWVNSQGFSTTTGDITGVTAGSGLTGGGTSGSVTISHNDTSSQSSVNNSGRTYIQDVTLDTYGHVTGLASATETVTNTNTTYSAGSGLSLSGTTFSHTDTSSQGSVNNSGRTYIQDVTLDTYGHVTGLSSATETVTNTDTNTTYSAGTGLSLSGTTFSVDSNVLRKTTYYNANTWLQFSGTYGLYWNSGVGAGWHIYPVNTHTMRWRAANAADRSAIRFDAGGSTYGTLAFTDVGEFQVFDEAGNERLSIPSSGNFVRDESYTIWDSGNVTAGSGISISGNTITNTRSDTNTTYSAGSGLSLSGTTFSHTDTSSQSSVNNSGRTYIQDVTLDTYGHVTGLASATETVTNTDTNTTYSAGSGLSLSSTTFSHSDTSSQSSVNNSGRTYIQDVTLDTYGHVTGLASATETVTNTDTNTTYSAGSGISLSGTTFSHSDTSSQSSVNNSGRTYVQDVTLDTYGHVTGLSSATETAPTLSEVDDAIEAYGGSMNNLQGASNLFGGGSSGVTNQGISRDIGYKLMNGTMSVGCVTTIGGTTNEYLRYGSGGTFTWDTIQFNHIQNLSALTALP